MHLSSLLNLIFLLILYGYYKLWSLLRSLCISLHPYFCLFSSSELICLFSHVGHYNDIFCILCKCTYFTFSLLIHNFDFYYYYYYLQIYVIIDLFSRFFFVIMNSCWITYSLKRFIPGDKILTLYFLLAFLRTELNVLLLWILLVSVYPLNKSETFQPLKSVMFQDLALQQGTSQLQTASADLWTFLVNTPFQLMIYPPLLNPTKFHH
jgi:hypothetical protein